MRRLAGVLVLAVAAVGVRSVLHGQAPPAPPPPGAVAIRLVFGLKDAGPTDWSGSVTGGTLLRMEPWRFLAVDRLGLNGQWTLTSHEELITPTPVDRVVPPGEPPPPDTLPAKRAVAPLGVTLFLAAPLPPTVNVHTAQGDFQFDPSAVSAAVPVLGGRALVERVPTSYPVADTAAFEDYPVLAPDNRGGVWVVWMAYENRQDRVRCRHFDGQTWSATEDVSAGPGDFYRPAAAVDARGRLWVAWSRHNGAGWDIRCRVRDDRVWAQPESLTTSADNNLEAHLVADPRGAMLLVWQGFRGGQAHILARRFDGQRWEDEESVSAAPGSTSAGSTTAGETTAAGSTTAAGGAAAVPGHCWDPVAASDGHGQFAVAWDAYEGGSYNIRLRLLRDGQWGPVMAITRGPRFHAHASLTYGRGQWWIAWDESGPNWGKDTGYLIQNGGTRLYEGRTIRIAAVTPTDTGMALQQPAVDVHTVLPENGVAVCELPQLAFDRAGRLWTVFRRRTARNPRADGWAAGGVWDVWACSYAGNQWSTPAALPDSTGRNDMRSSFGLDSQGQLWMAWATDHRSWRTPAPRNVDVMAAQLDAGWPAAAAPAPVTAAFAPGAEAVTARVIHPHEAADVARVRAYRITVGDHTYRIVRGDMHRHTDNSPDGAGDGTLEDLYRYCLDAVSFDFILVTDHNDGNDAEYPWWRREQSNDLYYNAGRFVPLYGYERSVPYPNGHRNVMFPERGVRTLPIGPDENAGRQNTGPILYPYLRANNGITSPHTSATDQGTDWRDNDPNLEPVVEIYQGYHASSEAPGAPRAFEPGVGTVHGALRPAGYIWNALAKGYRLGFQSSSDHISTHVSYACVITDDFSRRGIIEAVRKRHTYGATDNIVLDVRMGGHIMGDEFTADRPPPLEIRALGTARIARVDVVRDEKYVYAAQPNADRIDLRYVDMDAAPGTHHYYVRILQTDGQVAWGSPLWVTVK